jgi:hypothetical protein
LTTFMAIFLVSRKITSELVLTLRHSAYDQAIFKIPGNA